MDGLRAPQSHEEQKRVCGGVLFDVGRLSWPGMCAHMANWSTDARPPNVQVWSDGSVTALKRIPPLRSKADLQSSEILWDYKSYAEPAEDEVAD